MRRPETENPWSLAETTSTKTGNILIVIARVDDILSACDDTAEKGIDRRFLELLSKRELARWTELQHPMRKKEWLAARLLTKYVVNLKYPSLHASGGPSGPRRLIVEYVTREDILEGASSTFRHVELMAPEANGAPRVYLFQKDMSQTVSCSVSHSDGWVTTVFCLGDSVGIDIEKVRFPGDALMNHCFTRYERLWAERSADRTRMDLSAQLCLLWTLKEAAYKGGRTKRAFPWCTEVRVPNVMTHPLSHPTGMFETPSMTRLELQIFHNEWHTATGYSCLLDPNCVMSVVTLPKG